MHHGSPDQAAFREAIEKANGMERLDDIMSVMKAGSLEYTTSKAYEEADKAIAELFYSSWFRI